MGTIPDKSKPFVKIQWEYPIVTDKKFTIGFIDMKIEIAKYNLVFYSDDDNHEPTWRQRCDTQKTICFEVKTSIPSIGELIRQINMYKSYIDSTIAFFVVVPSDEHAKILSSQGIGLVKYPEGRIMQAGYPDKWLEP